MKDDPLNRTKVLRGTELPQAKLTEEKVIEIRYAIAKREAYRKIARTLTNENLAKKYGVHVRTIERISADESWTHV